jgi:hypothetical protein
MKVYRLLVYEGPEDWIRHTLNARHSVKGRVVMGTGRTGDGSPEAPFYFEPQTITEVFMRPEPTPEDPEAFGVGGGYIPEGVFR